MLDTFRNVWLHVTLPREEGLRNHWLHETQVMTRFGAPSSQVRMSSTDSVK